jgi:hypothetical protein|tara:strand:- start:43 stop:306 length:264 start_codon:yes stop_codon:yes gene_type:complete
MYRILNIIILFITLFFFFNVFKYYSSNRNIADKNFNRINIDQIINGKILDLPILKNDTKNVIEFNDEFSNEIKINKPRSFWNLFNSQ